MVIIVYLIQALLYIALLTPLLFGRNFIFPLITPKAVFFKIVIETAVFFALIYLTEKLWYVSSRKAWLQDVRNTFKNMLPLAVLVFGIIAILATIFAVYPYRSFWSTVERGEGLLILLHVLAFFFLIIAFCNTRTRIIYLIKASIYASALVSFVAIFQKQLLPFFGLENRLSGSLGNPDFLGVYLFFQIIFIFMLAAAQLFNEHNSQRESASQPSKINKSLLASWEYAVFGAIFCLDMITFILSGTRSAMLGFVVAVIFILVQVLRKLLVNRSVLKSKQFKYLGIFIGIAFFLLGTSFLLRPAVVNEYFHRISWQNLSFTFVQRSIAFKVGLKGFMARPLLGSGFDSMHSYYIKFYEPYFMKTLPAEFDRAHDVFIQWMNDTGIFGILSYLGIFFAAFVASLRIKKRNFGIGVGAGALVIGYAVNTLFILDTLSSYVAFFLFLGVITVLLKVLTQESGNTNQSDLVKSKKHNVLSRSLSAGTVFIAIILLIVYISSLYTFTFRSMSLNQSIADEIAMARGAKNINEFQTAFSKIDAELQKKDLIQTEGKVLIANMFFGQGNNIQPEVLKVIGPIMLNWFKNDLHKQDIQSYSYYLMRVRLLEASGQPVVALDAANHMLQITTAFRPELWGEIGAIYTVLGQPEKAQDAFDHYVAYAVDSGQGAAMLANFYQSNNKSDLAFMYLKKAIDNGFRSSDLLKSFIAVYQKANDQAKVDFLKNYLK